MGKSKQGQGLKKEKEKRSEEKEKDKFEKKIEGAAIKLERPLTFTLFTVCLERTFCVHNSHMLCHVDLTVLSIFQKAVTFDHNLTH